MNAAKAFLLSLLCTLLLTALPLKAQQNEQITVDTSHLVNSFSPLQALGGAVDRLRGGKTQQAIEQHTTWALTDPVLQYLLGAGWGTVSYRQNTELQIEAWHWNPQGTWSNPAQREGYFAGSAVPTSQQIVHSWAYPLPHRGATQGDGTDWSRMTDGDPKSYWKSNPYLTEPFTSYSPRRAISWTRRATSSSPHIRYSVPMGSGR